MLFLPGSSNLCYTMLLIFSRKAILFPFRVVFFEPISPFITESLCLRLINWSRSTSSRISTVENCNGLVTVHRWLQGCTTPSPLHTAKLPLRLITASSASNVPCQQTALFSQLTPADQSPCAPKIVPHHMSLITSIYRPPISSLKLANGDSSIPLDLLEVEGACYSRRDSSAAGARGPIGAGRVATAAAAERAARVAVAGGAQGAARVSATGRAERAAKVAAADGQKEQQDSCSRRNRRSSKGSCSRRASCSRSWKCKTGTKAEGACCSRRDRRAAGARGAGKVATAAAAERAARVALVGGAEGAARVSAARGAKRAANVAAAGGTEGAVRITEARGTEKVAKVTAAGGRKGAIRVAAVVGLAATEVGTGEPCAGVRLVGESVVEAGGWGQERTKR
ncbi:hypothetical protein PoB_001712200 [Plakobranchus ocellatus]|uniref:Uncharacterized protein n=1 Tax=Plakobranchus ocellatus TaxID=259542 RepID=A0AAV3Z5S8_9GAST|nr:hypothetical protein PoB_001712200 [Plakobranchus ocellatus]